MLDVLGPLGQVIHLSTCYPACATFVSGIWRRTNMHSSRGTRLRIAIWAVTLLLPLAAWQLTASTWPLLHYRMGVFFTVAAVLSAAIGGALQRGL